MSTLAIIKNNHNHMYTHRQRTQVLYILEGVKIELRNGALHN